MDLGLNSEHFESQTWDELGYGPGSFTAPLKVAKILERRFGHRKKKLGIEWRVQKDETGGRVIVYERVPMLFTSIGPLAKFDNVLIDISDICDRFRVSDLMLATRSYVGESSAKAITVVENRKQMEKDRRDQDMRHAARSDLRAMSKKKKQLWMDGPSGGF